MASTNIKTGPIIQFWTSDSNNIFASLNDVKSEKDSQFEKWQKIHSDIQRKFIYIDKILFKKR